MAAEITIPISTLELTIRYEKPNILLITDRGTYVQELFSSFAPWNPQFDDMEVITTGKPTEQGVRIKIASQNASFFFGATECKLVKNSAVWVEADQILAILAAGLEALHRSAGIVYGDRTLILSLHLQPKIVQFRDILRKFVVPAILSLAKDEPQTMAVVTKWPRYRITLDGSAALSNGIFVQAERQFDARASFNDMKDVVFQDEQDLFKLLDVVEVEG